MVRKAPIMTAEFGPTPYVENVGVSPEIEQDYMTIDNLTNAGAPFIRGFTKAIVDRVKVR